MTNFLVQLAINSLGRPNLKPKFYSYIWLYFFSNSWIQTKATSATCQQI